MIKVQRDYRYFDYIRSTHTVEMELDVCLTKELINKVKIYISLLIISHSHKWIDPIALYEREDK